VAEKYWHFPPAQRLKLCKDLGLETNLIQDQIVADPARFLFFRAARRVGKSFAATKRHFPLSLMPRSMHWIVAPTYDLAHKEFRYWLDFLQLLQNKIGKKCISRVYEQPGAGDLMIKTPWGATVLGKSASNPSSLVGEACDSVIMAEASQLKHEIWERYVRATLATKEGYATFASTPDSAGLWLYELELKAATMTNWSIYTMPAWECNHYSKDDIEQARMELSEDAFYEQYGGEWRFYTGRVYKMFKADVHLVEPFPIPASWEIGAGVDFGSRDPMAEEVAARSPTGEVYFCGEYYVANQELSTQDHAAAMLRMEERYGFPPSRVSRVADHHGLGRQLITDAARCGLVCAPCASNDRRARRDCAMSALTPHENAHPYHIREAGLPPGTYPKVFIFKGRCPNLVRELQFLRWREGEKREGASNDTEGDNHAVDGMEYRLERWRVGRMARTRRHASGATPSHTLDPTGYCVKPGVRKSLDALIRGGQRIRR
jgi:hypothetical protein